MVSSLAFVTPVIRKAIAALEENLPERIALFNANPENEVTLIEPVAYEFGAADPLIVFPTIEVASTQGQTGEWSLDRSEFDHDPVLTVVVWHEGERGELGPTYEMSLGMTQCVIEVLARKDAMSGVELGNDPGAITWRTEVIPADPAEDGREFRKWQVPVLITFRLELVEQFT